MKKAKSKESRRGPSSRSTKPNHFMLAVDPFVDARYQANAFHLAKLLQKSTGCTIEPVFVLGASGRGLFLGKEDLEHWLRLTDTALTKLLKKYESLRTTPPKILVQKSPFLRMDVKALVSYAKSRRANALIIGTQLKSALERGVLGSFAETLILYSAVPVIAIPPKVKLGNSLSPILFPTDFDPESSAAFNHCVKFAKTIKAEITILHEFGVPHFVYPEGTRLKDHAKWKKVGEKDERFAEKKKLLEKWKSKALQSGVPCSTKLTMKSEHIADVILSESKAGDYGLIAMAATKGPGKAWFTGSTPRWVLRHTHYPVWVYYDAGP
jgi:nucleotide-binding universal stress UspA family protein